MQSADQVTAFDPESPEFKAFRQSAISRRHSDLRSAEARNPQKHEAPNQNSKQNKQLYIYAINIIYSYIYIYYMLNILITINILNNCVYIYTLYIYTLYTKHNA